MKKAIGFLILIWVSVPSAYAFDDNRKGFFIGVGGGFHSTSIDNSASESLSQNGFASSFKIGGGITEKFILYYVRNASWYNDNYTFATGIAGIGASYYFSGSAPSLYVHAGAGAGDLSAPFDTQIVAAETGSGFLLGAGYQFKSSLSVEGTYMAIDVDVAEISSFQLLVNYLWF